MPKVVVMQDADGAGPQQAGLARYVTVLERLTPETLPELRAVTAPDVRFKDPFHDVSGRGAMLAVFERMFVDVQDLTFSVHHAGLAADGETALLRWTLSGRVRALNGRPWAVEGMSEVRLDAGGLVTAHIDYWDAASSLYERLPVIGWLLRLIRRRIAVL